MLPEGTQINSAHSSMIHDIQFDYYGDKIASCGSDGYVNVHDVSKKQVIAQIKVRDSPLFSLSWAHPRFGNVIAVSSYDGDVSIYREQKEWLKVTSHQYEGSVNCISFMPRELLLACGASDGHVFLLDNNRNWETDINWLAHESTVHGLSWSQDGQYLATAGADKLVKIWEFVDTRPELKISIQTHQLVKDVLFHPLQDNILVSGGEDGKLRIHQFDETATQIQEIDFHMPIWKLAFNMVGSLLTVSLEGNGQTQIKTLKQENNFKYAIIDVVQ